MAKGKLLSRGTSSGVSRENVRASRRQEKRTSRELKGRLIPGSGATWHSKGDVKNETYLVECKVVRKLTSSYRLRLEDLAKLKVQAVQARRLPVMEVSFGEGRAALRFAIIPWDDFVELSGHGGG